MDQATLLREEEESLAMFKKKHNEEMEKNPAQSVPSTNGNGSVAAPTSMQQVATA